MRVRRIPGVLGYAKACCGGLFYVCVGCLSYGMGVKRGEIRIFTIGGTSSISHRPRVVKLEDNVEKTVEYHMGLPYTVELKCYGEKFRASIRELPTCRQAPLRAATPCYRISGELRPTLSLPPLHTRSSSRTR